MALVPADRYGTALELAADVERWLADEPVSTWREPLPTRGWRWIRLHRPLVTGAAALLLAALPLLIVIAVNRDEASRRVERDKEEIRKQKEVAEANAKPEEDTDNCHAQLFRAGGAGCQRPQPPALPLA